MNSSTVGLRVAAAIFAAVALVQLARLVTRFDVMIGGHVVPLWPNAVALLIAASLSVWMWRLSSRGTN